MTVINGIEIDDIQYSRNIIREAIENNETIEDKLHVITVISNPCMYARRYILMKEFIIRMEMDEPDVILYVVELAYGKQPFIITSAKNPRHLQIRCETPLWHKENMINVGAKRLLPPNWKAMAWIDADLSFESSTWAKDTLRILNGTKDIVQLFSHAIDMNFDGTAMSCFTSFGHQYVKQLPYYSGAGGVRFWHPGYAWACTRRAFDKMGGIYDLGLLGSGDNIIALSLISKGQYGVNAASTDGYKATINDYEKKVRNLRLGYVPGVINHYFHGSKKNRQYMSRWVILIKHNYDPLIHVTYDKNGILVPTESCPRELLDDIMTYFQERVEDDCYKNPSVEMHRHFDDALQLCAFNTSTLSAYIEKCEGVRAEIVEEHTIGSRIVENGIGEPAKLPIVFPFSNILQ
jgi:hypothetical protein